MKVLLLLKGQPGSGKSTLAQALASILRWPIIDKDDARDAMQIYAIANPSIDWNTLSYDIMFKYAEAQLRAGLNTIIDCPLARLQLYRQAAQLAAKYNYTIALVETFTSQQDVWSGRLAERGKADAGTTRSHKPGSLEDVQAIMKRNNSSESWSESQDDLHLGCRMQLETSGEEPTVLAQKVITSLCKDGLILHS